MDYNKKNREEIYWVIYQLLDIIYKYFNHQKTNDADINKNEYVTKKKVDGSEDEEEESISMVLTQSKSRYAELKPPPRKNNKSSPSSKRKISKKSKSKSKSKLKRGAFSTLENVSSASDYDSQR